MDKAIQRAIYYSLATLCLLYLAMALQVALHEWLLGLGLADPLSAPGPLDLISQLAIFTNVKVTIGVLVGGVVVWFFGIRHDRRTTEGGYGNRVRAIFLSVLAALFGMRILFEVLLLVDGIGGSQPLSGGVPVAAPVAALAAALVAFAVVLLEWNAGGQFDEPGQKVAKGVALLSRLILVITAIWAIGTAIQSSLQQLFNPLTCLGGLNISSQLIVMLADALDLCASTASPLGAALAAVAVIIALFLYTTWEMRYNSPWLSNAETSIGMLIVGGVLAFNAYTGLQLAFDLLSHHPEVSLPQSLLATPDSLTVASYPFLGPLVAGGAMFFFYWGLQWWREHEDNERDGWYYFELGMSYPFGLLLFWGASLLLGHLVAAIFHRFGWVTTAITGDQWIFAAALFLPGALAGYFLWRNLEDMYLGADKRPKAADIYVWTYFIALLVVCAATGLWAIIEALSPLFGPPLDPTWSAPVHLATTAVVTGSGAIYYYRVKRGWF